MQKDKSVDKDKPHDLRDNLGGRVEPGGINRNGELVEPDEPDIVSPGLKEPPGQTTHE
jgi:hypothetical protein